VNDVYSWFGWLLKLRRECQAHLEMKKLVIVSGWVSVSCNSLSYSFEMCKEESLLCGIMSLTNNVAGRDSALRCPRRVQRRNIRGSQPFRPLHAGGDAAARPPYHIVPELFVKGIIPLLCAGGLTRVQKRANVWQFRSGIPH
jgi:hypothetical protein